MINLDLLDEFGPIQKFRISVKELIELFCRIHWKLKVLTFANEWVDSKGLTILIIILDLVTISRHLDTFRPFQKFHISAEDLSQVFCRIRRKLKVLIFAHEWVNSIGLGTLIINLDLLDEFHGI